MNNVKLLRKFKWAIKRVAAEVLYQSGITVRLNKGKVTILMYHRVLKESDKTINYIQPGMYVTESSFDKQMKFISESYQVISLQTLIEAWKGSGLNPENKYCVVTFDDGWLDNYENAFPILRKYGIPATIFIATAFIGTNHWFWPDKISYIFQIRSKLERAQLIKAKVIQPDKVLLTMASILEENLNQDNIVLLDRIIEGVKSFDDTDIQNALAKIFSLIDENCSLKRVTMNWDEIKEMSQEGVTFGSHTCNHKLLTHIPADKIESELIDSTAKIKEENVKYVPVFCYPNGYYNDKVQSIVERSGFEAAVTTEYGFEHADRKTNFNMKRIGVHNDVSSRISMFSFHLSGLGHRFSL